MLFQCRHPWPLKLSAWAYMGRTSQWGARLSKGFCHGRSGRERDRQEGDRDRHAPQRCTPSGFLLQLGSSPYFTPLQFNYESINRANHSEPSGSNGFESPTSSCALGNPLFSAWILEDIRYQNHNTTLSSALSYAPSTEVCKQMPESSAALERSTDRLSGMPTA